MGLATRDYRADDKTIFAELQELIVRHNFQLYYASLPTATAWGEFSRMNLPGISYCECMHANVIAKFAQNGYCASSDAIKKQSSKTPHVYIAYQHLYLLVKHFVILEDSEHGMIVISSYCVSNFIVS